ncbi:hypothetical protein PSHT_08092 [Puccinia striiformis]|uniref:DUF4219 domain-containing protein n=1 Tax=Puccinia striiformis TaxID=27350 RepID=A0A2S4VS82_9BASI|nr:hypothetical protein PSHT_08092 [Puccinia striiformis]
MAEFDAHTKTNIPPLTENNYLQWSMRMTAYLRHTSLLKYVTDPPIDLSGAAATAVATKRRSRSYPHESLSDPVFDMVVTPDIAESPFSIWQNIVARFASSSVNNKGRVWLRFMRYEYSGVLGDFINDMRKMLNEIRMLNLGVPDVVVKKRPAPENSKFFSISLSLLVSHQVRRGFTDTNPTASIPPTQIQFT